MSTDEKQVVSVHVFGKRAQFPAQIALIASILTVCEDFVLLVLQILTVCEEFRFTRRRKLQCFFKLSRIPRDTVHTTFVQSRVSWILMAAVFLSCE